jgi:hypothetical protein
MFIEETQTALILYNGTHCQGNRLRLKRNTTERTNTINHNPNINRNIINSKSKASNSYACTRKDDVSALGTAIKQILVPIKTQ